MVGDLDSMKLSEVAWQRSGKENFFFDNEQVRYSYEVSPILLTNLLVKLQNF